MTDKFSGEKRSEIMRAVKKSRNKSTELKLICFFKQEQIKGWRRNYKLFGNPDFVFPKKRIAVFVDGCFWHGHFCRTEIPATNSQYWTEKILKNQQRDKLVNNYLHNKKWQVIRIWECELKKSNLPHLKARLAALK